MKKFALLSLLLLSVSCMTEEVIKIGDDTPVPVMNAQLHVGDTLHRVFLNYSKLDRVEPLSGAVVRVYVNDVLAATAEELEMEEFYYNAEYHFKADFKAGDRVRIDATHGTLHAWSEVTVPASPTLLSVKTEKVVTGTEDHEYGYRYLVEVKDIPGEDSYYRISMKKDVEIQTYYQDNPVPVVSQSDFHKVWVNNSEEPVLSDGWMREPESEEDIMSLISTIFMVENQYNIFTDEQFRDDTYTLKVRSDNLTYVAIDSAAERAVCTPTVHLKLYSMSFLEYRYLISLCNFDTMGAEVNFISEPISLPSNVEGGIGFVSVDASAEYDIEMPSWEQSNTYYEGE